MAFKAKFAELTKLSIEEQMKFFQQRFVFLLGDRYYEVEEILAKFKEALKHDDGKAESLSGAAAADFMQKMGKTRTAMQRKAELADFDVNGDGRVSFVEYLCLHYKIMILEEFFKRKGEAPDVDMGNEGVGLTGVGERCIEEMFAPPAGLDPELEKMMKQFSLAHQTREKEVADLEAIIAQGGVKGMSAKNQLESIKKLETTDLNAIEARIAAAIKKAQKKCEEQCNLMEAERAARLAAIDAERKAKGDERKAKYAS